MCKFKISVHEMKSYGRVDVKFYEFLTWTMDSGERSASLSGGFTSW
jgi:hypothetical protein